MEVILNCDSELINLPTIVFVYLRTQKYNTTDQTSKTNPKIFRDRSELRSQFSPPDISHTAQKSLFFNPHTKTKDRLLDIQQNRIRGSNSLFRSKIETVHCSSAEIIPILFNLSQVNVEFMIQIAVFFPRENLLKGV